MQWLQTGASMSSSTLTAMDSLSSDPGPGSPAEIPEASVLEFTIEDDRAWALSAIWDCSICGDMIPLHDDDVNYHTHKYLKVLVCKACAEHNRDFRVW
jgi:hypothetical protein